MKTVKFFALVGLLFLLSPFQPTAVARLEQKQLDVIPNYVVIGAFSKQTNAIRFTDHAQKDLKLDAKFEMNVRRNLYYVYVLNTEDLAVAVQEARRLRSESEFTDTWVYRGSFDGSGPEPIVITPTIEAKPEEVKPEAAIETSPVTTEQNAAAAVVATTEAPKTVDSSAAVTPVATEVPVETSAAPDDSKEGTKFLFKVS